MQLKKSKAKAKAPLSPKASREHAAQHRTKAHFFVLYALIVLLTLALTTSSYFVFILWRERDDTNQYIFSSMVGEAISGMYAPVQQIDTNAQIISGVKLVIPTDIPGLMQSRYSDGSGVNLTTDVALAEGRSVIRHGGEQFFDGVPKAQKCSVGYIVKDATQNYEWRWDVEFTEIARVETGDGRTIVVQKNTDQICGDIYSGETFERLDRDLQDIYSY